MGELELTECAICGYPIDKTLEFVVYDEETLCMPCFQRITEFREEEK